MQINSGRIFVLVFFCHVNIIEAKKNSERLHFGNETEIEIAKSRILSRQKRYLIFPEGSNVQCVYCLTIGAYSRPGELVVGLTAALAWELPSKFDEKLSNLLHRHSRSVIFPKIEAFLQSRHIEIQVVGSVLGMSEGTRGVGSGKAGILTMFAAPTKTGAGLDGRSCVMRALCEAGQRESTKIASGTFVQELLHAIFKLRNDGTEFEVAGHREYDRAHELKENCSRLYPTCQHSIYDLDF